MCVRFPCADYTCGYPILQYLWVNYFQVPERQNDEMDKYAIRREALRTLINNSYGGVKASFAKAADIDESYVSRLLYPDGKAGLKRIGEDTVEKISRIHPYWLKTATEIKATYDALLQGSIKPEAGNVSPTTIATRRIPLISLVAAGTWCEAMDTFQVGDAQEWIETTANITKSGYALRVEGDSMEPKFPHGAILIVDPNEQARNGSYVIVRQNGSDATFKQLVMDGGQSYLKPLNDRYPIMAMRPDAVICGVVKRVEMDV